jgi:hypothetical protein
MGKHIQSFHLRHMQIDKGNIGMGLPAQSKGLLTVAGLIDLITGRLQHHGEIFADIPLVIGD